jgi:hypothetical protein
MRIPVAPVNAGVGLRQVNAKVSRISEADGWNGRLRA